MKKRLTKIKTVTFKTKKKKNNNTKKYLICLGLLSLFLIALVALKTTLTNATGEIEYIDQQQLSYTSGPYFTDQWQSFTAGKNGQLSKISVYGTIRSSSALNIYEGEGTTGTLLSTQIVPEYLTEDWIDIVINGSILLRAGGQYTFQFIASGTSNNLWWDHTNPYAGGRHSYDAPAGQDLAFKIYAMPKLTKTLVIFLTKYPDSNYSDLSGVKKALEDELYSNIKKMSYHTEILDVTYAGPYIGDIENCDSNTNAQGAAIVNYAVNRAFRDGIDVTQYENFIALRNYDFADDDCFNPGEGGYSNNINYDGGILTAGTTTVGYPRTFTDTSFGHGARRTVHEFLHGYGHGTSHTTELECYTDPNNKQNTRVPYYYIGDENILATPYCARNKSSKIDVMGISPDEYIETNAITKLQYNWLNLSNIITFNASSSSAYLEKEIILKPTDKENLIYDPQMVVIPITNTTKAYVLELRSNAPTGTGVYLYLIPDRNNLVYQEQYLLNTGESYFDGYNYFVAPMKVGTTTIDSQMKLSVNIESATTENAIIKLSVNDDSVMQNLQTNSSKIIETPVISVPASTNTLKNKKLNNNKPNKLLEKIKERLKKLKKRK